MRYEGMLAETIALRGHGGAEVASCTALYAREGAGDADEIGARPYETFIEMLYQLPAAESTTERESTT